MLIFNENNWTKSHLKLPEKFRDCGTVFLNGEIYIFGGWGVGKELYKLELRTLKWTRLADMNERRTLISSSCLEWNEYIWVLGGDSGGQTQQSVERYDPKENKWTKMP